MVIIERPEEPSSRDLIFSSQSMSSDSDTQDEKASMKTTLKKLTLVKDIEKKYGGYWTNK